MVTVVGKVRQKFHTQHCDFLLEYDQEDVMTEIEEIFKGHPVVKQYIRCPTCYRSVAVDPTNAVTLYTELNKELQKELQVTRWLLRGGRD